MTTVKDLVPEFIEHLEYERQLQPMTLKSYRYDLIQFHRIVGKKPLAEIDIGDVRAWMRQLNADGLTVSTIKRKLYALSTFYEFQILLGNCETNLSLKAQRFAPKQRRRIQRRLLTREQWQTFTNTSAPTTRESGAWGLLGWLGTRNSELRKIRCKDVSFETGTITIAGKGGHERRLPIPDDDRIRKGIRALMAGCEADDYLLRGTAGGFWSRQSFTNAFDRHLVRCGLPDEITPHWLRHTVATYLSQHLSAFELKDWLGHLSTRTTEVYIHNNPARLLDALKDDHPLLCTQ